MDSKPRSDLDRLRQGKAGVNTTTNQIGEHLENDRPRWVTYDSGAFGHMGYFEEGPRSFANLKPAGEIMSEVRTLQEQGIKVAMLDIMGQGKVGVDLGADMSIGWTYKNFEKELESNRRLEEGDIFDPNNLKRFIASLTEMIKNGYQLTDVFFRSEGGVWIYANNPYAMAYLYDNVFRPVYALAGTGTRFFLGSMPTNPDFLMLIGALTERGYGISDDESGNYLLEKSEQTPKLPSLRSLGTAVAMDASE